MKKLILASGSPRRQQLMNAAGYDFQVVIPSETAECGVCSRESPPELVSRLAWQKAADVVGNVQVTADAPSVTKIHEAIVIACDTVAECHGHILGKPNDRKHAEEMLRLMSGRPHHVYTGVCVWSLPNNQILREVEVTQLYMDRLQKRQLTSYLDSAQWEGKAGAFGYQDGLDWVHIVSGSESNVVGLPMERLAEMLARLD